MEVYGFCVNEPVERKYIYVYVYVAEDIDV